MRLSHSSYIESLRRIYGEIIRGRTRVRVVTEAPSSDALTPPRFLLSPYRSGTTLFRFCLDSHPDLAVPPETDFLLPLLKVLDDDPSLRGLEDVGYNADQITEKVACFARQFHDTYAVSKGAAAGWLDKSPRYAESPETLARAYSSAKFIIMHRRPLDQIHSFTRGGTFVHPALGQPESGRPLIEVAAQYWASTTRRLLEFSKDHYPDVLEITYEDLCSEPELTLRSVTDHLQLEWNEEVLNYHKHPHDLGREAGRVSGTRGFALSTGAWHSWPDDWVTSAHAITAHTATRIGYQLER